KGLPAVWNIPAGCLSGQFSGAFCDDDGRGDEAQIDRLVGELNTPWACADVAGRPAFCPGQEVSRAESAYALERAAGVPINANYADGFRDDNGSRREAYLNAAKAWGIIGGYNNGQDAKPNDVATRDTLATMLVRMYTLPSTGVPDAFS